MDGLTTSKTSNCSATTSKREHYKTVLYDGAKGQSHIIRVLELFWTLKV